MISMQKPIIISQRQWMNNLTWTNGGKQKWNSQQRWNLDWSKTTREANETSPVGEMIIISQLKKQWQRKHANENANKNVNKNTDENANKNTNENANEIVNEINDENSKSNKAEIYFFANQIFMCLTKFATNKQKQHPSLIISIKSMGKKENMHGKSQSRKKNKRTTTRLTQFRRNYWNWYKWWQFRWIDTWN